MTVLVTSAYFLHITTFYFILKWVPKIVVDMGFSPSSAAGVLVWANVGGATGGAVLGLLSLRFGLKHLTMFVLVISTIMVAVFGRGQANLAQLSLICAITGFFTNAGVVGLYGILAQVYPTQLRATGTGFAIGVGRAGAMLAPIIAGYLFHTGYGLQFVAVAMGGGLAHRRGRAVAVAAAAERGKDRARASRRSRVTALKTAASAGQPQRDASIPGTNCRSGWGVLAVCSASRTESRAAIRPRYSEIRGVDWALTDAGAKSGSTQSIGYASMSAIENAGPASHGPARSAASMRASGATEPLVHRLQIIRRVAAIAHREPPGAPLDGLDGGNAPVNHFRIQGGEVRLQIFRRSQHRHDRTQLCSEILTPGAGAVGIVGITGHQRISRQSLRDVLQHEE